MNTERPDNDDAKARGTGGASGHAGPDAPKRTDREPVAAEEEKHPTAPAKEDTAGPETGQAKTTGSKAAEPHAGEPGATAQPAATEPGAAPDTGEPGAAARESVPGGPRFRPESGGEETVVGEHGAAGFRAGDEPAEGSVPRRSPALIASVAAAVLLVGGGGACLAAGASSGAGVPGAHGGATPPPLALDGHFEEAAHAIGPGGPTRYGTTYRADGALPDGPGSAAVHHFPKKVTQQQVATLARALGLGGRPVAEGGSWRIGGQDGTGPTLRVDREAPGSWTFSRNTPGTDNCKGATCKPLHEDGPVASEAVAKKAAAPVLKAAGLDEAKMDASRTTDGRRVVNADPEIGGLPSYGWTTGVVVGARGGVVGAHGRLARPVKGDTYPVVDARKALELLNASPGTGDCVGSVPPEEGRERAQCAPAARPGGDTVVVDSAVFGLAARSVDGRPALVPSWLFEVRPTDGRDTVTVTYPAVDPRFLAPRSPSGGASPSRPGGEPTPAPSTRDVAVQGYTAEGKELTVVFTGGVCADYGVTADESGDRVTVRVTETPRQDQECILIGKQYEETVRLDAPLGDRTVVDTGGDPVPPYERLPVPPAG